MMSRDEPKPLPYSKDSEQSVLGGLMHLNMTAHADSLNYVLELLSPEDFYRPDHALIFKSILSAVEDGSGIDFISISDKIRADATHKIGDHVHTYVGILFKDVPGASNIKYYAKTVKNGSLKRQLITVAQSIVEKSFEPDFSDESLNELMAFSTKTVFELDQTRSSTDKVMKPLQPALKRMLTRIQDAVAADEDGQTLRGLAGGYAEVDARTSGYEPSKFYIQAGRPAMGKTTRALNEAEYMAINNPDLMIAFFSVEMPMDELAEKITASAGRANFNHIRNPGKLVDDDWVNISQGIKRLSKVNLRIDDDSHMTPNIIRQRLRATIQSVGLKLGAVFVDHIHLMRGDQPRYDNENAKWEDISNNLRQIAKEFSVPVIALAQCNRSCELRTNKRPIESDLRGAGAFEQDAHVIQYVYRDAVYAEKEERLDELTEDEQRRTEIITRKVRAGRPGTDMLTFFGEFQRFDNYQPMIEGSWE